MDPRLQEMLDHHEIRRLLAEYCHGCDRTDAALMGSVYTGDDSFDDHGQVKASGPEYARIMTDVIRERTTVVSHILGQSLISVDGDTASSETFFFAMLQLKGRDGEPRLNQLAGRFVDRLERRDGKWKIRHRVAVRDTSIMLKMEDASGEDSTLLLTAGRRDRDDPGVALMGIAHQG